MANPFDAPLPSVGQKPWTLNPAIIELRDRQGTVEDVINTGRLSASGLADEIAAAAASVDVQDGTVAAAISSPTSDTNAALVDQIADSGSPVGAQLSATFVQAAARTQPDATAVDMYGDSLTQQGDYQTKLAEYTGLTITNRGIGGQGICDILLRMGAIRPLYTVAGGQIPGTTTPVTLTLVDPARGWRTGGTGTFTTAGSLAGIPGTLTRVLETGVTSFTRSAAGAVVPVPDGARFVRDASQVTPNRRLILWAGRNNTNAPLAPLAELLPLGIASLATAAKEFLIIGTINARSEGTGTTNHARIVAYNKRQSELFGSLFYDIRRDFIDRGMALRGINPSSADLADVDADRPPGALMADDVHPNAEGYLAINYLLAQKLQEIEWITSATLPPIPGLTITNVVSDPSVEAGSTGYDGSSGGTGGASSLARENTQAHSGTYSFARGWTAATTSPVGSNLRKLLTVEAGKEYTGSVWVRATKAQRFACLFRWYAADGTTSAGANSAAGLSVFVPADTWARVSVTALAPSGAARARLDLHVSSTGEGSNTNWDNGDRMYGDDWMVTEGGKLYPYFEGTTTT